MLNKEKKPLWFQKALKETKSKHQITVDSSKIFYQKWGNKNNPGIVLVHGSGGHSHWWDFIAPSLTENFQISALDLSGMGDSEHRPAYKPEIFAKEIISIAEDSGFFSKRSHPPVICGHSLGGYMSVHAANLSTKPIRGVIMIDSPIRPPNFDYSMHFKSAPIRRKKNYPDKKTILSRFRLTPEQPCKNSFLVDYVAKFSITKSNGGYQWKFDDKLFEKLGFSTMNRDLAFNLKSPIGFIYGSRSTLMTKPIIDYIKKNISNDSPLLKIDNAYHHVLLDKPEILTHKIISIIDKWL